MQMQCSYFNNFGALTLWIGWHEEHLLCRNRYWQFSKVHICDFWIEPTPSSSSGYFCK